VLADETFADEPRLWWQFNKIKERVQQTNSLDPKQIAQISKEVHTAQQESLDERYEQIWSNTLDPTAPKKWSGFGGSTQVKYKDKYDKLVWPVAPIDDSFVRTTE